MRDFQDSHRSGALAQGPEKERDSASVRSKTASNHGGAAGHSGFEQTPTGNTAGTGALLRLQRQLGNRFVQRVVGLYSEGDSGAPPDVQQAIESSRGGGQPLDSTAGVQIGKALGADFGEVRVHTDGQADALNRSLNAKAFTTGKDVYFRHGEYNPGSSAGKQLLVHELTHVVQQNPGSIRRTDEEPGSSAGGCACGGKVSRSIQTQLTVGHPGDIYEQEADQMAQAFPAWEQRANPAPAAGHSVRRAMPEEEKKKEVALQTKPQEGLLQPQPEEEKKEQPPLQAKFEGEGIRRQEAEEEE